MNRDTPDCTDAQKSMNFCQKIKNNSYCLSIHSSSSPLYTLIAEEEKYSHLRLGIKVPFHSGAFFKTLNYSFLEEACDEAQTFSALTESFFHVWQATNQLGVPASQSARPPGEAANQLSSLLAVQPTPTTSWHVAAKLHCCSVRAGVRPPKQSISWPAS